MKLTRLNYNKIANLSYNLNMNSKLTIKIAVFLLVIAIFAFIYKSMAPDRKSVTVKDDDKTQVEMDKTSETTQAEKYADIIQVNQPKPNAVVKNPIILMGKARGSWFFEGSFPVELVYAPSKHLSILKTATADGDWTTNDFVEFGATLDFPPTAEDEGYIILRKDNPSGLPENDAEIRIPVRFR